MAYERRKLMHKGGICSAPAAAVNDVLQGHEQAEDIPLPAPEQAVAHLREGYARQLHAVPLTVQSPENMLSALGPDR